MLTIALALIFGGFMLGDHEWTRDLVRTVARKVVEVPRACRFPTYARLRGIDCRPRWAIEAERLKNYLLQPFTWPEDCFYGVLDYYYRFRRLIPIWFYNVKIWIWPVTTPYAPFVRFSCCLVVSYPALLLLWWLYVSFRTRLIYRLSDNDKTFDIRRIFRTENVVKKTINQQGHSHPKAAGYRSTAYEFILSNIRRIGKLPYSVSMSTIDQRLGLEGCRDYYWPKDLQQRPQNDKIRKDHALMFIDVDYYIDLRYYAKHCLPMYVYTFDPVTVGGKTTEGSYRIVNDEVQMTIAGGANYSHKLWDYSKDIVTFSYWWGSVVYAVEKRKITPDRMVVLMAPVRKVYGPFLWGASTVDRRQFTFGRINAMIIDSDEGNLLSVSNAGSVLSVTAPLALIQAIVVRCKSKKGDFNLADIERNLRPRENARDESGILFPIVDDLAKFLNIVVSGKVPLSNSYQSLEPLVNEDGKDTGQITSPAIVENGIFCPKRSMNNDAACIKGRIDAVRNNVKFPGVVKQYQREFTRLLIPDSMVGRGVPLSIGEMREIQDRPTQRALAEASEATMFVGGRFVSAFQKSESYPSVNDPRNISTLPADHRLRYGGFTREFCDKLMKDLPWYAFSKNPKDLSSALYDVCQRAKYRLVGTDFSRFDGTHSEDFCEFELSLMLRFFPEPYQQEVTELLRGQYNARACTMNNITYNTGWSRLSGSSDTSLFNTIDNAFVAYCVYRKMGCNSKNAWESLGLYGGDDGLSPDADPDVYMKVASSLGLKIKPDISEVNTEVTFLGRLYPNPWVDTGSVSDPLRQIRKLHFSAASEIVPKEVALRRKADGFLLTDVRTPIIVNWALAVNRIYPVVNFEPYEMHLRNDTAHWSTYSAETQFVPPDLCQDELVSIVAKSCGITVAQVEEAMQVLDAAETIDDFPEHVIQLDIDVKIPAVLQGEIVEPVDKPICKPIKYLTDFTSIDFETTDHATRSDDLHTRQRARRSLEPRRTSSTTETTTKPRTTAVIDISIDDQEPRNSSSNHHEFKSSDTTSTDSGTYHQTRRRRRRRRKQPMVRRADDIVFTTDTAADDCAVRLHPAHHDRGDGVSRAFQRTEVQLDSGPNQVNARREEPACRSNAQSDGRVPGSTTRVFRRTRPRSDCGGDQLPFPTKPGFRSG